MKKFYVFTTLLACIYLIQKPAHSQVVTYHDSWGKHGITIESESKSHLVLSHSLEEYFLEDVEVEGVINKAVRITGVLLPNDEGAPDLPGLGRYVAIPQGASVGVRIIASRTELIEDIDIAPAPRIPLDIDSRPLQHEKNMSIYSEDAFFPENPVILSEPMKIRGIDAVMLGITPFQYNPVTRELVIYRDIQIEVTIEGESGQVGDDRLRSRWWESMITGLVLNPGSIPEVNGQVPPSANRTPDYEYIILTPDQADFISWADSIKVWRTLQGIKTGVVTTTEIGGNTATGIKNYINNAYNTWDVPPVAVLLLGDYSTGSDGITSYFYPHVDNYPDFASDNYFADVTGDDLPDIIFSRITARNAAELELMITKFLDYERNPPIDPEFYNKPITALGWQTERWFQICSETIGGYLRNVRLKDPVRINALYSGNPGSDPWSTGANTSTVLNYFGPSGLGYIPATPQELGGFTGGTATDIVNAINSGSYLLMHRDHGNYTGWGEPAFSTAYVNYLNNINNELPFVFSINCQTGAYHRSTECLGERFHRHSYNGEGSGALGFVAPTEVSYSFLNDTYIWGVFDNMYPDFMPGYSTQFPTAFAMPAFGNAAGKYFLFQSNWPAYPSYKQITYRLFHHHGDPFMVLYSDVPQSLAVAHASTLASGETSFTVTADAGSTIALTVDGEILAVETGTGSPQNIAIPPQTGGQVMVITVTKQNYYRHSSTVDIVTGSQILANFTGSPTALCAGEGVAFTDDSSGPVTSWTWTFHGGTPSTYSGQVPPLVHYTNAGTFTVELTVSDGINSDNETKTGYVTVYPLIADFSGNPTTLVFGGSVTFTDLSTCNPTGWTWTFEGGDPASFSGQVPPPVYYHTPGSYDVTLQVTNANGINTKYMQDYVTVTDIQYCASSGNTTQEWIAAIDINGQNNSSAGSPSGYEDFTGFNFILDPGATYNIALVPGFTSTKFEYWRLWIDFNQDGDFTDAGEELFSASKKRNTVTGLITIPAGLDVTTRMRVSMSRSSLPSSCEIFAAGEVEDYTVTISYAPPPPEPPSADFIGNPTSLAPGESVLFTDLSTGNPTSYHWQFNGGTPSESFDPIPSPILYNQEGNWDVTLTVSNAEGQSTVTKAAYIKVSSNPPLSSYCEPASINNSSDGINVVTIGTNTNNTSPGGPGYVFFTSPVFNFTPGQSYSVSLSPFNNSNRNFWRIWVDLNGDGDLDDADETLFSANNKKGTVNGSLVIPSYAPGQTRMRITMRTGSSPAPCDDNFDGEVEDYNAVSLGEMGLQAHNPSVLSVLLYPNPVAEQLHVNISGNKGPVIITVFSAQGNKLYQEEIRDAISKIDMTGFFDGLYFIHATDGEQNTIVKVVVNQ